jgi:hypothetical protein
MSVEPQEQVRRLLEQLRELQRENSYLRTQLQNRSPSFSHLTNTIEEREREIKGLKEDLGSLRVLEAFMRSGVMKDLGIKDDPAVQNLLREFFRRNLLKALDHPETLTLAPPPSSDRQVGPTTEDPENERRYRAA